MGIRFFDYLDIEDITRKGTNYLNEANSVLCGDRWRRRNSSKYLGHVTSSVHRHQSKPDDLSALETWWADEADSPVVAYQSSVGGCEKKKD